MNDDLSSAFCILKKSLGNHGKVAKYLGISRDHYCAIRNGRVPIPKRTADLIILKAQEVSACCTTSTCVTRGSAAVSV